MAKAKKPVSVAGIEFDALISEDRTMEATVPEYAVESGYNVSDAIILGSETLAMVLFVTDTPVTWYSRHGSDKNRVKTVCKKMEELYYAKKPVKVVTSDATYTDMVIESLTISKSLEVGYAREIPISFRKIRTTKTATTTIPSNYGKSGATKASAGTASTSSGKSGSSSSTGSTGSTKSSNSSSSSSSKSGSNSTTKNKSSILHSAASSLGLI